MIADDSVEMMAEDPSAVRRVDAEAPLLATDPYNSLSKTALRELAASARWVNLSPGELLVRPGDASQGVYLVVDGALKLVFISVSGQEKVLELLMPNRSFGQAELFSGGVFNYYGEALTRTTLLLLPERTVSRLVDSDSRFARSMLACLGRQFHSVVRDVKLLTISSARQRLLQFLVNRVTDVPDGEASVDLLVNKSVLASRLGVTPETLSRTLAKLIDEDVVSVKGRHLLIHDVGVLREHLENAMQA